MREHRQALTVRPCEESQQAKGSEVLPSKEEVLDFLGVSLEEHYPATWPDGQESQGLAPPH